jgi:glucose-1-phosphate thymidylyltransferase
MKGVILAGGRDERLHPATLAAPAALLPVYDKPMIHYPLSVLLSAGIRDVVVVVDQDDLPPLRRLLGDGTALGADIGYAQREPSGVFVSAAGHLDGEPVAVILGNQLLHGNGLRAVLREEICRLDGCVLFGRSTRATRTVAGLYLFDHDVVDIAKNLPHPPWADDDAEIADVVAAYRALGRVRTVELDRGLAWLDVDTCDALIEAGQYVRTLAHRQGLRIGELDTSGRTPVRHGEQP